LTTHADGTAVIPRYAFVAIHYEWTPNDAAYILGTPVLISSITRHTVDKHVDILILTAPGVAESSKLAFTQLGGRVIEVENINANYEHNPNLAGAYNPRFAHVMNKLHIWNLVEYERVIYLDADCIVINDMLEVFETAPRFAAVMLESTIIHTGMLVVKPDRQEFENLLKKLPTTFSHDGADQGFLISVFNHDTLKSALLLPEDGLDFRNAPTGRLLPNHNLNALWYMEHFSWKWIAKIDAKFTDWEYPAYSLTYPGVYVLKPWAWYCYPILESHWVWFLERSELKQDREYWKEFAYVYALIPLSTLLIIRVT